nr:aminotransferase class III-fold pyridoxal phosphate-dependent enzyme [Nitrospinaceae bacterium]
MSLGKNDVIEAYEKHVMSTYIPDRVMVKGQGTRVWDADGQVYLDFGSGIAVTNTGHAHPVVAEAIANQARSLLHVSNLYYTENQAKLAQRLSMLSLKG